MTDPTLPAQALPAWLQWGSFGLLCLILLGCAWFVRWLAKEFFGHLVQGVRDVALECKSLGGKVDGLAAKVTENHDRVRYRLTGIADDLDDLRTENFSLHSRLEATVKEGRTITSRSTAGMRAVSVPDPPRPRQRSRPDYEEPTSSEPPPREPRR